MTAPTGSKTDTDLLLADLFEQVTGKLQAGEALDVEAYAADHPQCAQQLRELLPTLEFLVDLSSIPSRAGSSAHGLSAASSPAPARGILGDFQILGEIGRGGMGIVYQAEQISLDRRVALKVLPFAAVLDPKHLQRFKNEARAAASLDHPNIVHVHSVGCDRGVHYYAMQYIEGQTLAEVISQASGDKSDGVTGRRGDKLTMPTPTDSPAHPVTLSPAHPVTADTSPLAALSTETSPRNPQFFRTVARLGIQAAEALEHAHQMGVVHRDIKPSNLMVDDRGHLWITDFGLAMTQTDANLTMSGDLLGTLRYMSPEQVQAKHGVLDHRTDVYSLGLTLYELLTFEPAFPGDDRQKLLRQVIEDDPRPPRQLNSEIPKDLETIVLKATAKEPQDRYATAQQLADDLGRFLEDQTIRARRPTLAQRATKWSRRHRPVVWSAAVALAMAVIGLSISTVVILGKEAETQRALQQAKQNEARAKVEAAKANAVVDLMQQMLASANPEEVKGADYTVRQLLDDFSEDLGDQLQDQPEVEATIRSTIGKAYWRLGINEKAGPHLKTSLELRRQVFGQQHPKVAQSLLDYAWVLDEKGNADEAEVLVRKALAILRKQPNQTEAMIYALRSLQKFLTDQRRHAEADTVAAEALAIAGEEPAEKYPIIADILHGLARSQRWQGNLAKAEALARNALAIHRKVHGSQHPETAWCLTELATVLRYQGNYAQAEVNYREALAIFRSLQTGESEGAAHALLGLASALQAQGDHAGLEAPWRETLDIRRKQFGDDHPKTAWARYYLSRALKAQGDKPEARAHLAKAFEAFTKAAEPKANDPQAGRQSAVEQNKLAWLLATCPEQEFRDPVRAVELAKRAVQLAPEKASIWNTLGVAQYRAGDWDAAIDALEKSLELQSDNGFDFFFLAMAHWQLGEKDEVRQWYEKAVEWMEKNKPEDEELRRFRAEAEELMGPSEDHHGDTEATEKE